jgi:hypothetical protein
VPRGFQQDKRKIRGDLEPGAVCYPGCTQIERLFRGSLVPFETVASRSQRSTSTVFTR